LRNSQDISFAKNQAHPERQKITYMKFRAYKGILLSDMKIINNIIVEEQSAIYRWGPVITSSAPQVQNGSYPF